MVRVILSALCLFAVVGFVAAEEKKADAAKTTTGKFKSLKDGTLTISVVAKKGDEPKDMTFKVGDDLKATVVAAKDDKKELAAKEAFKDLKEGTTVAVKVEGDKVTAITITTGKK
jgi:exosome complex RNA-binding protein Csl4